MQLAIKPLKPRHCAACLIRVGFTGNEAGQRTGVSKTAAGRAARRFTDIQTRVSPDTRVYCADCLLRVGCGVKLVARLTGLQTTTIGRWRKRRGYGQARRRKIALGKRWRGGTDRKWMERAWADEWRDIHRIGELQHWAHHPAITGGRSPYMVAYYADVERHRQKSSANAMRRYHRIKATPAFKAQQFARNQQSRIVRQAKGYAKTLRKHEYLGCTYQHAADYIEEQLPPGWSWDNYGTVWEIDHVVQLSDGRLLDAEHILRVCHYTNLRPMAVSLNRTRAKGEWKGRQHAA